VSAVGVSEKLWERAFQLSYFVLMDRSRAHECVARAVEKLAAQRSREKRRVYWRGGKKALTIRRISRPVEDTLQWLTCLEAEACEKEQELRDSLTEADMVVRYVKYLAQLTTVSSSFHVNVGFNRLLRSYTTPEVQQIYELATARYPAAEEYRKAKGKLLNQLAARFSRFLKTRTAQYGEVQFETHAGGGRWSALVEECLEQFAPWSGRPSCFGGHHGQLAPANGHAGSLVRSSRRSDGRSTDRLETSRCHWFMHSTCYARLVEQLGFEPPGERLSVPRFLHHDGGDAGSPSNSLERRAAPLSGEETRLLRDRVAAVAAHAEKPAPGPLKLVAHGTVCATLVPGRDKRRRFEIPEGTRLIEVWSAAAQESRIMAIHWVDYDEGGLFTAGEYTIDLPGGHQLTLSVTPTLNVDDQGLRHATVAVESHATSALRQRLRSLGSISVFGSGDGLLRPIVASVAFVALGVLATDVYFQSRLAQDRAVIRQMEGQLSARQSAIAALESAPPKESSRFTDSPQPMTRYAFSADTSSLRGPGKAGEPVVTFPSGESVAVLEMPAQSGERAEYRVTLSSFPQQQERLSEAGLKPLKSGNGWIVEFTLPSSLVESDTHYLLTLTSTTGTDSAHYLFEVRKNSAISTH